jgi:hypothetical protein
MTPFYFRVGDHCAFIVDFLSELLLRISFIPMCRVDMRILVSCEPKAVQNYLERSE